MKSTIAQPNPTIELETIDAIALATATGGRSWKKLFKEAGKTAVNAYVNYENAVLPDQVNVGKGGVEGVWNIPKIPRFNDNPYKRYRDEAKRR